MDVDNSADVDNMVKTTLDLYGHIDILFNSAGIGRVEWIENHSLERDLDAACACQPHQPYCKSLAWFSRICLRVAKVTSST